MAQNVPRMASLSVNPATPSGPSLAAVSTNPSRLTGGSPTTWDYDFTGATDGAIVQLSSSNTAVVQVPPQAIVNGGAAEVITVRSNLGGSATATVAN